MFIALISIFFFPLFLFVGDSTITSLLEDLDLLDKVAIKLDRETPGLKNWLHFAWTFGIPKNECDVLKPKGNPSPTIKLMEHIVQINPDLTVKQLIQTLKKMKRLDVVNALTKHLGKNYSDVLKNADENKKWRQLHLMDLSGITMRC